MAFDRTFQKSDGGFHSDGNAIGQTLTVDYGKAYEIDKNIMKSNPNTIIASIILIIIVALLIFVGYKRRKLNEE